MGIQEHVFIITEDSGGVLQALPKQKQVGRQHDHEAQELVFLRPAGREQDDLVLHFAFGGHEYRHNIGRDNRFLLTRALTGCEELHIQAAFCGEDGRTEHAGICRLVFGQSLKGSGPPEEPPPDLLAQLADRAWAGARWEHGRYDLLNLYGLKVDEMAAGGGAVREVRAETLPAEAAATVRNEGTPEEARLVFGIPRGAAGSMAGNAAQDIWVGDVPASGWSHSPSYAPGIVVERPDDFSLVLTKPADGNTQTGIGVRIDPRKYDRDLYLCCDIEAPEGLSWWVYSWDPFYNIAQVYPGRVEVRIPHWCLAERRAAGVMEVVIGTKQANEGVVFRNLTLAPYPFHGSVNGALADVFAYVNRERGYWGKSWLVMGDSVIGTPGVRAELERLVAPARYDEVVVSGATLCDRHDTELDGNPYEGAFWNNTLANQVQKVLNWPEEYPAPDVILIAAGIADAGLWPEACGVEGLEGHHTNGVETVELDAVDRTQMAGAVRWVTEKLRQAYPAAEVFWCSPCQAARDGAPPVAVTRVRDCIAESAARLAAGFIDNYARSGIYSEGETPGGQGRCLYDGLNPNVQGCRRIARSIVAGLKNAPL